MDSALFNVFARRMAQAEVSTIDGVINYMKEFAPHVDVDNTYARAFLHRIATINADKED